MTHKPWMKRGSVFASIALLLVLISGVLPGTAEPSLAAPTLTFIANADARVLEAHPGTNYGTAADLIVARASNADAESYLRFTVGGISGTVQNASLRLYDERDPSSNGPVVYRSGSTWSETGITWSNRPARISGVIANKGRIQRRAWVEYNVTSVVTGNGTYSFVLAADSSDGVKFSSREGGTPPQLVLTLASSTPTPTSTPSRMPSPAPTGVIKVTPTLAGDPVLVGAGDISSCTQSNDEATAKLLDGIPGTVFTVGDNVYPDGTYSQFVNCYGPTWGRHRLRTKPAPGNHDYHTPGAAGYFQYFNNPAPYYAYSLGGWRIYSLNSEINLSAAGPQATWLKNDLAAHPSLCALAYWHKPRWSSGSVHGSDPDLQALWQILYSAGAELVISGHDHIYERFAEMNAAGSPASPGLREITAGTGGAGLYGFGTILPASRAHNGSTFGVLKLTLHPGSYDWKFVPVAGKTFTDSGTTRCH
jgi:hypothetical protein